MGKRKTPYVKELYESTGASNDTSANLYISMLTSAAWRALTAKQQVLYLCCKAQRYAEKRKPLDDDRNFTMNRSKWCHLYGLYNDGNHMAFYRDMEALIEKGFVVCVESGQNTRTKSVYAYSSMWRHYGTSAFEVPLRDMTPSMRGRVRKLEKRDENR